MDKNRLKRPCLISLPLMLATLTATQGWASTIMGGQSSDKSALLALWNASSGTPYAVADTETENTETESTESENTESTESENATAQKFKMEVQSTASGDVEVAKNTGELVLTSEHATIEGGTVTLINTRSSAWNPFSNGTITIKDKAKNYLKVKLNTALAANDIIKLGNLQKAYIASSTDENTTKSNITNYTYTIAESDDLVGKTEFYLWAANTNTSISSITVTQRTALTASFAEKSITGKKVGDDNIDFPTLTVKAGNTVLTTSDYKVTYSFSPENIAEVEDDQLSFVGAGTTTVTATITPTSDLYLPTTASFTVTVEEDKQAYIVTKETPHTKHTVLKTSDGNLQVTLGGWMFQNTKTITNGTTSDELGKDDWGGIVNKTKLKGYSHCIGEGTNNNPRQEDGSNAQPQSTAAYNAQIVEVTDVTLRDQMFNVPASGAFFSFAPKTNGKVTAVIFQSGVFDSTTQNGSTKYVYRPQRRTFIVDEAGNFVPNSATASLTDGALSLSSYEITNYTWDLNNSQAPTADEVKTHFVGLDEFTLAATQKNGVYESNLSYEKVKNELIKNGTENLPTGARGWCTLCDAPVTYTFDVKAGKTYYLYNFGSRIGLYGFKMEANNVTEDVITLNEASTSELSKTADDHVAKVSLDRTFKGGVWNAAVLPFSLNKQQVDAIFGQTYGYGNTEEDGTQILYFDHVEGTKAVFMRHANNTIVAGKPFLIKPKTAGDITLNTANINDYPYVTIEATDEPADWCSGNGYVWKSSYKPFKVKNGEYFIGGKDGKFYRWTGNQEVEAKGYRGYLAFADDNTSGAKPALQVAMKSTEDNDGNTTLIEGLTIDGNGRLNQQPANGKVYTVSGQLVGNDTDALSTLPQGIYIVNGKKIVK